MGQATREFESDPRAHSPWGNDTRKANCTSIGKHSTAASGMVAILLFYLHIHVYESVYALKSVVNLLVQPSFWKFHSCISWCNMISLWIYGFIDYQSIENHNQIQAMDEIRLLLKAGWWRYQNYTFWFQNLLVEVIP